MNNEPRAPLSVPPPPPISSAFPQQNRAENTELVFFPEEAVDEVLSVPHSAPEESPTSLKTEALQAGADPSPSVFGPQTAPIPPSVDELSAIGTQPLMPSLGTQPVPQLPTLVPPADQQLTQQISETTPISTTRTLAPPRAPRQPKNGVTIEKLVLEAFNSGFSDIHLGVGERPRFRDRGQMVVGKHPITDLETFDCWLEEILDPQQIQRFRETLEFDGATQYEGVARVRINIFISLHGPAMVMRLIPLRILTLEELNLPLVFQDLCHYHKGLILVTGPTGSGKSTTLAAMVDHINGNMPKHIISIEDPIEFVHKSRKSLIRQREVGIHTHKFDNALKASLREDPDVILIGEMRDRETVNTALKAAQTGHLVFGTLHTNSAVKTIERILNLYNPEEQGPMRMQVAESLVGVISQSLVRTTDGKRAAIHEIMINTDAVKDYILRGDVEEIEALIPECTYDGMVTMNQCLYRLYEEGRIDEETALEASPKPNEMAQILRGRI